MRDSDCTLVFSYGPPTGGTKRTIDFAHKHGKSCHVVDLEAESVGYAVDHICRWLLGEIEDEEFPAPPMHPVLNVAGSRESKVKGIGDCVAAIMVLVLVRLNPECRNLYSLGGCIIVI